MRAATWPVPSIERVVETSFGQTFVRESGPVGGPPVLMLPGVGSPGLSLAVNVKGLSGPFRTFAIDNIHDHGRSVETRPVTGADDFAQWLDEVRAGLGLDTVNLWGLSYGGWISAQYALRFPQRVRRVALLAPAGTTAPIPWGFVWRAILCLLPGRFFMRSFLAFAATETLKAPEGTKALEALADDAELSLRSFAWRKMVPPLPLTDEQWRAYTPPTLYLAGDREVMFPPHEAVAKLNALAPTITTVLLPGAGHDFFAQRADEVNRRVREFFSA
jgi:pimeloyl-ACP methyl ester carboxylesterase